MNNRYAGFEELRLTGEVSHIPDHRLNEYGNSDPRWQRVTTGTDGYLAKPVRASVVRVARRFPLARRSVGSVSRSILMYRTPLVRSVITFTSSTYSSSRGHSTAPSRRNLLRPLSSRNQIPTLQSTTTNSSTTSTSNCCSGH